jgi:hypothetical protein
MRAFAEHSRPAISTSSAPRPPNCLASISEMPRRSAWRSAQGSPTALSLQRFAGSRALPSRRRGVSAKCGSPPTRSIRCRPSPSAHLRSFKRCCRLGTGRPRTSAASRRTEELSDRGVRLRALPAMPHSCRMTSASGGISWHATTTTTPRNPAQELGDSAIRRPPRWGTASLRVMASTLRWSGSEGANRCSTRDWTFALAFARAPAGGGAWLWQGRSDEYRYGDSNPGFRRERAAS